jgi:hypothetical protein
MHLSSGSLVGAAVYPRPQELESSEGCPSLAGVPVALISINSRRSRYHSLLTKGSALSAKDSIIGCRDFLFQYFLKEWLFLKPIFLFSKSKR